MGDSCSIYLFCSIYRSASTGIHRSENNLFVFLTLGLWCKGNFLLFTVIFLLKTGFALTAWEAKLSFFWWLVVLPYLEAELIKTFRGPFSVIPFCPGASMLSGGHHGVRFSLMFTSISGTRRTLKAQHSPGYQRQEAPSLVSLLQGSSSHRSHGLWDNNVDSDCKHPKQGGVTWISF